MISIFTARPSFFRFDTLLGLLLVFSFSEGGSFWQVMPLCPIPRPLWFPMGFLAILIVSLLASQFDTLLSSSEGGSFWQVMPQCPVPRLLPIGFLAILIAFFLASHFGALA